MVELSVECSHYWLIEPPEGPLSEGVCKICGEKRMFGNSVDFLTDGNWNGLSAAEWRGKGLRFFSQQTEQDED